MNEIYLTIDDNESEIHLDVGDSVKIVLNEASTTGYTWDIDGELPEQLEMVLNDYKLTYKKSLGGSGKRVVDLLTIKKGSANLKLKYWQEWNGDDSIEKRFSVSFIIE